MTACVLACGLFHFVTPLAHAADPALPKYAQAPARFHGALQALERGRRRHVAILQIGDSHTAGDQLSGRLRTHLQRRFGNAGRGFLPPGAPYAHYRPHQVHVTQTPGWQTLTSNKSKPDPERFGLSGQIARAIAPEDAITIELTQGLRRATLGVGLVRQPGGGGLEVVADNAVIATVPTASDEPGFQGVQLDLPPGTRRIFLHPFGDGPVAISDHTLLGADRGVTLSNLGFSGAQVHIMSRWDWPRTAAQIADIDPALIILAFGTNEGFAPVSVINARYAREFEHRLQALMTAAPNASIVIVGPPDANLFFKYCRPQAKSQEAAITTATDADKSSSAGIAPGIGPPTMVTPPALPPQPPEPDPADTAPCRALSADERRDYDDLARAQDRRLCRWHTPAGLALVRQIQREIAARHGVLFFDWFALTDNECGADRWFRLGLMHKDRVHFKQAGYWRAADALYQKLMAGYRRPVR